MGRARAVETDQGSYTRTSESTLVGPASEDSLAYLISRSVAMNLEAVDLGAVCPGEAGTTPLPPPPP